MLYLIIFIAAAAWVFFDARKRKNAAVGWALGTFVAGAFVLPFYMANRHLLAGEVREGGAGWNVCKWFVLIWTITMIVAGISFLGHAGSVMREAQSESKAAEAGAAIGGFLGAGLIFGLWLAGSIGGLVLGLILKKSSVVERGPTAPVGAA